MKQEEFIKLKEITLEITNMCNNKCLHCSSMSSPQEEEKLNISLIKNLLEKYSPEYINLSGGEPLMHEDIHDIVKFLYNENIKIKLYTSGNVIDFKIIIDGMKNYINTIVFPLYSINPEIFNKIVNTDSFHTTMENIKYSLVNNINTEIHIVPMSINIDSLELTVSELIEMGISRINILKLVNQGRCNYNQWLVPQHSLLIEKLENVYRKFNNKIKLGVPFNHEYCLAGIEKLVMMADGNIIPCESYKDGICKCERVNISTRDKIK